MLITKTIKIKLAPITKKHYEALGYEFIANKEIEIPVEHLPRNSSFKIKVKCCGICEEIKEIQYYTYLRSLEKSEIGKYCCRQCFSKVRENIFLEKYGVISPMKLDEFKDKKKKTMQEKYGVDYPLQNKDISKKSTISNKKTLLEKYGVDNSFLVPGAKENKDKTMIRLYGTKNHQDIPETKKKTKNTLMDRYGVDHNSKKEWVQNKIRKTREERGYQRPKELISEFETFRSRCVNLKNKKRKELFSKWDGFDFYDNECIKDFIKLHHNHPNFPTIDHKISILYGFQNNMTPEELSKDENLCITKRSINSSKNRLTEIEFKNLK